MNNYQSCWDILNIEPTTDKRMIKKAYALKAKSVHPEENETEFRALRTAYETALMYASHMKQFEAHQAEQNEANLSHEDSNTLDYSSVTTTSEPSSKPIEKDEEVFESKFDFDLAFNTDGAFDKSIKAFLDSFFQDLGKDDYNKINNLVDHTNFKYILESETLSLYLINRVYAYLTKFKKVKPSKLDRLLFNTALHWSSDNPVDDAIYDVRRIRKEERANSKVLRFIFSTLLLFPFITFFAIALFTASKLNLSDLLFRETQVVNSIYTKTNYKDVGLDKRKSIVNGIFMNHKDVTNSSFRLFFEDNYSDDVLYLQINSSGYANVDFYPHKYSSLSESHIKLGEKNLLYFDSEGSNYLWIFDLNFDFANQNYPTYLVLSQSGKSCRMGLLTRGEISRTLKSIEALSLDRLLQDDSFHYQTTPVEKKVFNYYDEELKFYDGPANPLSKTSYEQFISNQLPFTNINLSLESLEDGKMVFTGSYTDTISVTGHISEVQGNITDVSYVNVGGLNRNILKELMFNSSLTLGIANDNELIDEIIDEFRYDLKALPDREVYKQLHDYGITLSYDPLEKSITIIKN